MRRETADYSPASEALPRDRADEPDAAFVFAAAPGDSYEICLTTSFGGTVPPRTDPLAVYERLRSGNPARLAF
ncbi:4-amino-4-deoxychorismate synthase [Aureococcus anophagefferens]|uniref:4-amino-4-deoxychorismate synthase n=1 Tax=Aureococcus anophagefferens TaxID=44056 RepID=A0ABR1FQ61_AURAN